mmetsp:Transcript_5424/g.9132  ORF Transcript_5424/g.9132 Transcript_5424/m.9132 type:complete len:183 (-) Transcript_5424:1982-2530(-)
MIEHDKLVSWERGIDRIADLKILPEVFTSTQQFGGPSYGGQSYGDDFQSQRSHIKHVELNDVFEQMEVHFSIFSPFMEPGEDVFLEYRGMNMANQMKMRKIKRKDGWLVKKYGQEVVPWQSQMTLENLDGDNCGQWKNDNNKFQYCYQQHSTNMYKQGRREREPMRQLEIQNPCTYRGHLGV